MDTVVEGRGPKRGATEIESPEKSQEQDYKKKKLVSVDTKNLDDICDSHHLHLLSKKLLDWKSIAYYLELDEADIQVIKHDRDGHELQKLYMLQRWKRRKHSNATYKVLYDCFVENELGELAEDLLKIMQKPVSSVLSETMKRYRKKLEKRYETLSDVDADHWPPRPLEAVYINLALIKQQRVVVSKIDDAFTKSTIHSCPDDVLHEKEPIELHNVFKFDEKIRNKCILIEAGPGLGKTMLSIKICKDWAKGDLLQDYDAVILLLLRYCKKANSVADLFLHEDKEFKKDIETEIRTNEGSRVCFIVDGFDELSPKLQKESIFLDLVKIFPNSMIIYTSRPVAAEKLRQQVVSRRIEIIGFKYKQVQEYIMTTLVNLYKQDPCNELIGKDSTIELIKAINSHPYIGRLVHIPINLAIITYIFYHKRSLPFSHSELYSTLVRSTILRYLRERKLDGTEYLENFEQLPNIEKKQFHNICTLAFRGLQNNKVTFVTRDLRFYSLPDDINGLGLLNIAPIMSECGTLKCYHFMHLTLQEFCAAFHISKLFKLEQHNIFERYKDNPKFQVVWQFYAGLNKLTTRRIFAAMIPSSNVFSPLCKSDLVQLLMCLYEANIPDLCELAIGFMNGIIDLSFYEMDLLCCSALAYFISNCSPSSIKALNLGWCGIGDDGLLPISHALSQLCKSGSYVINLDLDLSYNDITGCNAHLIAKLLSAPILIKKLVCTGNRTLGDDGVETIVSSTVGNYTLQTLQLRGCGIGIKGIHAISKLLRGTSNLTTLDISESDLDPKMVTLLAESLANNHTLTNLQLKWCKLGPDTNVVIDNLLHSSLLHLDLRHNHLGNTGIASIAHAINRSSKLSYLNLDVNGITDDGVSYISELIMDLNNLSELHISGNFQEHGIEAICNSLTNNRSLYTLGIMPCTTSLEEQPSAALSKILTCTNITSLHIIPPENCSILSAAISSSATLKELKVCIKLVDHFAVLLDGIKKNASITNLDFLFIKIEKQWLNDLASMLQVKTNLVSLVVNGEIYPENCVVLHDGLSKCKLLQRLTITPYKRIIPPTALEFVTALQALDSLEIMTLAVDIHQTQGEGIDDHASNTALHLKLVSGKEHVTDFRNLEALICSINERRVSLGKPELYLHILVR